LRTTECLILHRGAILTDKPGLYDFWLVDRRDPNRRLSNMASVTVRDVSTTSDSAAVQKIRSCPAQYATFVYLKGGDHLKKAFQVMAALAEGTSSYRALARTLLAVTYCQTIYTDPANAVYRDKDPVKVDQYFPTTADPSVSAELRTSLASLARKRFTGVDVPPTLAAKIEQTLAETR